MTAVPPPVPPEIVEKATHALKAALWGPYGVQPPDSYAAAAVIAAVYGDIVEAARRDALTEAARLLADDGELDAAYTIHELAGLLRAEDSDAAAPRDAPTASVSDQGADPRIPGTDGAQIAAEPVFPSWVMQAMDDHQQRAETRMRRLLDEEPTP